MSRKIPEEVVERIARELQEKQWAQLPEKWRTDPKTQILEYKPVEHTNCKFCGAVKAIEDKLTGLETDAKTIGPIWKEFLDLRTRMFHPAAASSLDIPAEWTGVNAEEYRTYNPPVPENGVEVIRKLKQQREWCAFFGRPV